MGVYAIGSECCNNCVHWNCHSERKIRGNPPKEVYTDSNCDKCDLTGRSTLSKDSCGMFCHIGGITRTFKAQEKHDSSDYVMSSFDSFDESTRSYCQSPVTFARNTAALRDAKQRVSALSYDADDLEGEAERELAVSLAEQKKANERASELMKEGMSPECFFKDKAVEFMHLLDKAKGGDGKAQYEFACAFFNGTHGARDEASLAGTNDSRIPRYWCRKAAENGLVEAQYHIGHAGWDGDEKSIEWLRKAADQGHVRARKEFQDLTDRIASNSRELLSECIALLKQNMDDNDAKAISYIRAASSALNHSKEWKASVPLYKLDQKFVDDFVEFLEDVALLRSANLKNVIGLMFEGEDSSFKYILKKDGERAVRWFKLAAEAGSLDAMDNLGICYANGVGVVKDDKIAVHWYCKAAQNGLAWGQYHYACRLISGEGIEKDIGSGRDWLQKAAAQGLKKAKERLEVLDDECDADNPFSALRAGWKLRKKRNYSTAVRYFKKAEAAGLPEAKYALAKCYYFGDGVEENKKLAVGLFVDATRTWFADSDADLAYKNMYADACDFIGDCYLNEKGVEKDVTKALSYYKKAARCSFAGGSKELGYDFLNASSGVNKDIAQSVYWLQHSVWSDDGSSWGGKDTYTIGYLDEAKVAFESEGGDLAWINLLKKTAEDFKLAYLNDAEAQVRIGDRYFSGSEVDEKDLNAAVYWWHRAAINGNMKAQYNIGDCYKYGLGVDKDSVQAMMWYEKAIHAESKDSESLYDAMYELSELLLNGEGVNKDEVRGVELMKNAAENGHAKAQWMWGGLLINPSASDITCIEQDISTGVEWMQKSADQGFGMAECTMAAFYVQGIGVEKDFTKAKELYTRALEHGGLIKEMEDDAKEMLAKLESAIANESCDDLPEMQSDTADDSKKEFAEYWRKAKGGDASAQWYVGHKLVYGKIVKMDEEEGVKWLRKSAEQEDANAAYELGDCYRNGWSVEEDITEAFKWYKKAAVLGEERACFKVGYAYYFGKGLDENEAEAFIWFTKAAEKGHAEAQCRLAECYLLGNGVEQDYEKAREWYCKSAEQGEDLAQFNLGKIYYFGKGIEKNYEEAFKWFLAAAEQDRADAQVFLGTCYRRGLGINKDMSRAFEWYSKSAEQGKSEAQFWAGKFYAEGWGGIDKDLDEAAGWYEKSAEQGNLNAICALGWCYQLGNGVEQDYEKAVEWFSKGAEKNDGVCINNLARLIEDGKGEEQDYNKALELFKKATECDCARANYHIGRFYENGLGVDADIETAKEWYQKAADNGDEDAKAALARLG